MNNDRFAALVTPVGGHVHEVFETPVLFGVPEVKLDLEP